MVGVTYLVLVLVEDDQIDSNMVVNIFVAGIIGTLTTYWWYKTYEEGLAHVPDVVVIEKDPKTGATKTLVRKPTKLEKEIDSFQNSINR